MKQFVQLSSNQITTYIPDTGKEYFQLMSELVFSSVESNYAFMRDEKGEPSVAKFPETETFRFFATSEALTVIRDRINDELKLLEKLAKVHRAE